MKRTHPAVRIIAAVCLLLVTACGDRHEPMKPTTLAVVAR